MASQRGALSPISLATSPSTASPISETSAQALQLVVVVRGVEAEEVGRQTAEASCPSATRMILGALVLSFGSCAAFALNSARAVAKWLAFAASALVVRPARKACSLNFAVQSNLTIGLTMTSPTSHCRADAARRARRDHELRLHLLDDLAPDVDVRQLRAILRHVRIRLEDDDRLLADRRRPVGAEPLRFGGRTALAHLRRDGRVVVRVGDVIVVRVLARRQHAAQGVSFVDGPGHYQHVGAGQRALAAARGFGPVRGASPAGHGTST